MALLYQGSLRNWRSVEVAGYSDPIQNEAGGAFVLYDEAHVPLLARAFPIASGPHIFTEAVALRQTLEAMVLLGEERILLCTSSRVLLRLFRSGEATGSRALDGVVAEGIEWNRRVSTSRSHLILVPAGMVSNALSLARTGAISRQHIQCDRPLLVEEMLQSSVHFSE